MDFDEAIGDRRVATDFDRPVYCVLGLPFDARSLAEVASAIRHAGHTRTPCFVTTPNLNYVIACRTDVALRESVLRSDLSVPDGMPLIWVARLLGVPLHERVAGSSLFDALRRPVAKPLTVYLFGGPDGVSGTACEAINRSLGSGLSCAGSCSPGFVDVERMSTPEILATINSSRADFLVVALPVRKGQMWILANLGRLSTPIVANLGAVVNFVAGTVDRAPLRWQRLGLEWLWRIRQEPQLWRRYLRDGLAFMGLLTTEVLASLIVAQVFRFSASEMASAGVATHIENGTLRIVLSGGWTAANLQPLRHAFRDGANRHVDIDLELGDVRFVDSACIGLFLLLLGHQRKSCCRLTLHSVPRRVRRQFDRHGATYLLES